MFEGRISPDVKANYLASPPLVVAYALAGSMTVDITSDPSRNAAQRSMRVGHAQLAPVHEDVLVLAREDQLVAAQPRPLARSLIRPSGAAWRTRT